MKQSGPTRRETQIGSDTRKLGERQWRLANGLCVDCGELNDSPVNRCTEMQPQRCRKHNDGRGKRGLSVNK